MFAGVAILVAAPLLAAAPPQFVVPPRLPAATVGTKYTYSFCRPIAATRNGVCGSLKTPSTNPNGGGGSPYIFSLRRGAGFPPNGLALSNRTGILAGTVRAGTRPRIHRFTVCASSARAEGVTCRPTALPVQAAPKPQGLADDWEGTYKETFRTLRCGNLVLEGAASASIRKTGAGYEVSISYVGNGFDQDFATCAVRSRIDNTWFGTLNAATPSSLTGRIGGFDVALTQNGPNELVGTAKSELADYELTLRRK